MNKSFAHWLDRSGIGNIVCICAGSLVLMLPSFLDSVSWIFRMFAQVLAMQVVSFFLPSYLVFLSASLWVVCGISTEWPIAMGRHGFDVATGLRAGYFWGFMCAGPLISMLYRKWRTKYPSNVVFVLSNVCGQILLLFFGWVFIACRMGAVDAWILGFKPLVFTVIPMGAVTATGMVVCTFFFGTIKKQWISHAKKG